MDARIEGGELAAHRLERERKPDIGRLDQALGILGGEHAQRERDRRAIDQGRGILGAEREIGREAGLGQRFARRHAPALVDRFGLREAADGGRHMGERGKIAGSADRALLRDDRVDPGIQASEQALDQFDLRAGIVRGEGIGAQQHGGAGDVLGEGLADARGMGVDALALVLSHLRHQHALVLEQADAGIEGVHERRLVVHEVRVDMRPRRGDGGARGRGEARLLIAAGGTRPRHAQHLPALQRASIDRYGHGQSPFQQNLI